MFSNFLKEIEKQPYVQDHFCSYEDKREKNKPKCLFRYPFRPTMMILRSEKQN